MLVTTKAIILKQIKFNDTSIILHLYTQKMGRLSAMVYGLNGKNGKKPGLYQPLFLTDLVLYVKNNRDIQKIKEYRIDTPLMYLTTDINKSAIALFIADVLYHSLREESADEQLFEFLYSSIQSLDAVYDSVNWFHVVFLAKLAKFLGFAPQPSLHLNNYLDLKTGLPVIYEPNHKKYLSPRDFQNLEILYSANYNQMQQIKLLSADKNVLLNGLVNLFELYLVNFSTFKSYSILQQVFND